MREGNNPKLRGGGLHHVAVEASDFGRSLRFYTEGLGFREVLRFPEEDQTVTMLDTGDGTYVELFSGGGGERPKGSVLHFALRTADCDGAGEEFVRLRPENGDHEDLVVPAEEAEVQGRVVYVVHPPRGRRR